MKIRKIRLVIFFMLLTPILFILGCGNKHPCGDTGKIWIEDNQIKIYVPGGYVEYEGSPVWDGYPKEYSITAKELLDIQWFVYCEKDKRQREHENKKK